MKYTNIYFYFLLKIVFFKKIFFSKKYNNKTKYIFVIRPTLSHSIGRSLELVSRSREQFRSVMRAMNKLTHVGLCEQPKSVINEESILLLSPSISTDKLDSIEAKTLLLRIKNKNNFKFQHFLSENLQQNLNQKIIQEFHIIYTFSIIKKRNLF